MSCRKKQRTGGLRRGSHPADVVKRRDQFVDRARVEETFRAMRRQVREGGFVKAPRLHHAVLGGDGPRSDPRIRSGWPRASCPARNPANAPFAAARSIPTSDRTKRPRPRDSDFARSMSWRAPAPTVDLTVNTQIVASHSAPGRTKSSSSPWSELAFSARYHA